jgi:hypothetical protein
MLPLLPALILLILQGPSSVERMAWDGRLPAALHALGRQIERSPAERTAADEIVLASLLAVSQDPALTQALLLLLEAGAQDEAAQGTPALSAASFEPAHPPDFPLHLGTTAPGFLDAQRSRDGPLPA